MKILRKILRKEIIVPILFVLWGMVVFGWHGTVMAISPTDAVMVDGPGNINNTNDTTTSSEGKNVLTTIPSTTGTNVVNLLSGTSSTSGVTLPTGTGLPENSNNLVGVMTNLLKWILTMFGAIALIAFVVSGIIYLTSAGDTERIERAKKAMIYAIIGVIIGLGGFVIVSTINKILSGTAPTAATSTTSTTTTNTTGTTNTSQQQQTTGSQKDGVDTNISNSLPQ